MLHAMTLPTGRLRAGRRLTSALAAVIGALVLAVALSLAAPARAATATVSTCDEASLRAAIAAAAPGDTITFACSGTITLTATGGGPIILGKSLAIDGSGQAVTISGGGTVGVFEVTAGVTVTLQDLAIANGKSTAVNGAGGVLNHGTLNIIGCTFRDNVGHSAGAIFSSLGVVVVSDTTFSGNAATDTFGAGAFVSAGATTTVTGSTFNGNHGVRAGGILGNGGSLSVQNSTLSGNTSSWSAFSGSGGAIYSTGFASVSVTNSTLTGNTAFGNLKDVFGGIAIDLGMYSPVSLKNTILSGNLTSDQMILYHTNCGPLAIADNGGNLSDDISCVSTLPRTTSPALALGPLADNGGPTQTVALGVGSVAIDAGSCLQPTDQRGLPRPGTGGTKCDSGAYEDQGQVVAQILLANMPADITTQATSTFGGTIVTYTPPTVVDWSRNPVPGATVACVPASGSAFADGTTTVTCIASDATGGSQPATFTVTVYPYSATTQMNGVSGSGLVGGTATLTATLSWGSAAVAQQLIFFSLNGTSVGAALTNTNGVATLSNVSLAGISSGSYPTAVEALFPGVSPYTMSKGTGPLVVSSPPGDTTAPVIAAHGDETAEATSASGAIVTYTSPATSDAGDGMGVASCAPASGSTFPLGLTTVTCHATDAAGNAATQTTFKVTVKDTKAPVIAAHSDETAEATGLSGATVTYASPATSDAVDGTGVASCSPASGSTFVLGATTVTCNATDAAGNAATPTTFNVTVTKPKNTASGTNITIQPIDPATGTAPVTLIFSSVLTPGDTTVATSTLGPTPPNGYSVGSMYFDLTTTATYAGPVTVCFEVGGLSATDRLIHYDNAIAVDITVDPVNVPDGPICGTTMSLSPFVVVRDTTPPAITCDAADGLWHGANVSIHCTASDAGSGLAASGDASFSLTTLVAAGSEDGNAPTGSHQVCDAAGNCATAGPITGNRVDRKAPAIGCAVPDGSWHAANVSLGCTASDVGSGPAVSGDASFNLTTSVAAGAEDGNASTGNRQVCDVAGNCATVGPITGNKVDRKAPLLTCAPTPTFLLNQAGAAVSATVFDGGSGALVSPVSVVVSTSLPGPQTASVTGLDNVGNQAAVSCSYDVVYGFGGFMTPLPKSTLSKSGSAIPVKFVLTDASGQPIAATAAAALASAGKVMATLAGPGISPQSVLCGWNATGLFFQCNIKTPSGLKTGSANPYTITVSENLGTAFVTAPPVGSAVNPEVVYFK